MGYGTPVATSSTGRRPGQDHNPGGFNRGRIYDRTRGRNPTDKPQPPGGEALELLYRSSAIDTIVFNDDYDTGAGGWTPSSFRSSRTNKAPRGNNNKSTTTNNNGKSQQQQGLGLEDLMDSEDLAEFERRRVLVPVRGHYLTQMLAGTTGPGDHNDINNKVTQFCHALIDLGSRGLGYGIMLTATSTTNPGLEPPAAAGVSSVTMSKKRPLGRPTNNKRLKLSISSYGEDDDDEDTVTLRPKKLRTLGNFTAAGTTIQKSTGNNRSATGTVKFVGKNQRTAAAAAVKPSTIRTSNETNVFIRADCELIVYTSTTETGVVTRDGADSKEQKPATTTPVPTVLADRSRAPRLVDPSRPEHKFLAQLSEELSSRFHSARSPGSDGDGAADPKLFDASNHQLAARQVQPYGFNPLLLKRFGINPSPQPPHKLQTNQPPQPDEVVDNSSIHINLYRNESFLRTPANRDLFNRIFG